MTNPDYDRRADIDDTPVDDARADDLRAHDDGSRVGDARADDLGADDFDDNGGQPLLDDSGQLFDRWQHVQAAFVDSPRKAVSEASDIVGDVLDRLSRSFDAERRRLDETWESGGEPSTEDLRMALRRYRDFFERLLAA
jgi:hypothetical protein